MSSTERLFVCTGADMHPYACDGPGKCIHCDRTVTLRSEVPRRLDSVRALKDADWEVEHDPATCQLCLGGPGGL
jgi:ferredoxin